VGVAKLASCLHRQTDASVVADKHCCKMQSSTSRNEQISKYMELWNFRSHVLSVAYLECAKGGAHGVWGTPEVPQWGPGAKPR